MSLKAGTVLQNGKYKITATGQGSGFSVEYQASHTGTGQSVLIKTLHPSLKARSDFAHLQQQCVAQIRQLAQCHHPHLARVLDSFKEGDRDFWVIDNSAGTPLLQMVQEQGPLPETLALHYLTQVSRAVTAMHLNGLLHGNIQPQHICRLSGTEAVVVTDLGLVGDLLARSYAAYPDRLTPGYAALEQYRPSVQCVPATDVYGLAATLYYLLTAQTPIAPPLREQGIPLPSPCQFRPELSRQTEQAILQGLAIAASERPATIADWLKQLPQPKSVSLPQGLKRSPANSAQTSSKPAIASTVSTDSPALNPSPTSPVSTATPIQTAAATTALPTFAAPTPSPLPETTPSIPPALPTGPAKRGSPSSRQSAALQPPSRSSHSHSHSAPMSHRWLPWALALTSITAAGTGAGLGLAFRLHQPPTSEGGGFMQLRTEQSFPPSENWPGSIDTDAKLYFEEPVVLEDELQQYQEPEPDYSAPPLPEERIVNPDGTAESELPTFDETHNFYEPEPTLETTEPIEPEASNWRLDAEAAPSAIANPDNRAASPPSFSTESAQESRRNGLDNLAAPVSPALTKPDTEKDVPLDPQSWRPMSPAATSPAPTPPSNESFSRGDSSQSPTS